jgi:hypothetical protein
MGDQPPAVYDVEDKALNARIARTNDGYDGKYGDLIGYWFEMKLPRLTVPFLGKARVDSIVSRMVKDDLEAKGIKAYKVPRLQHQLIKELVAKSGFFLECREFQGNWQDFTLEEMKLVRNTFAKLYFLLNQTKASADTSYLPIPRIDGTELKKLVFKPLGWPKEIETTVSTVEVLQ